MVRRYGVLPPAAGLSYTDLGTSPNVETARVLYPLRAYAAANSGTNWYVHPVTGSDGNAGTIGSPKQTLAATYAGAASGDTINVRGGTSASPVEVNEGELLFNTKPITIQAYLGETVVMDGRGPALSSFAQVGGQWRTTHVLPGFDGNPTTWRPNLNTGQGARPFQNLGYSNLDARWDTDYHCLLLFPVTVDGVMRSFAHAQVSTLTRSGTTATCTTSAAHGLSTGDTVHILNIASSVTEYNGTFSVTVTGSTTFTYTMTGDPGGNGAALDASAGGTMRWAGRTLLSESVAVGNSAKAFYDPLNNLLYLGQDPSGKVVRAAQFLGAFKIDNVAATGSTVRGLVIRCYADQNGSSWPGMVYTSQGVTFENCHWAFGQKGLHAAGTAGTTRVDCSTAWCGGGFGHSSSATNHVSRRCQHWYVNYLHKFNQNWDHGGEKYADVSSCKVIEGVVAYSGGMGIWFDGSSDNNAVIRNYVHHVAAYAIQAEICAPAAAANAIVVAGNLIHDSFAGLSMLTTSYQQWFNNTVVRCTIGVRFWNDNRKGDDPAAADGGKILFVNNLIVTATGSDLVGAATRYAFTAVKDSTQSANAATLWFGQCDHNAWQTASDVTFVVAFARWHSGAGGAVSYAAYANWQTATGLGTSDVLSTSTSLTTWLTNPAAGDYRLKPGSAIIGVGRTLTAAQRDLLGPSAGLAATVAPNIGAFNYPGWVPQ